jgi:arylsulfatase
MSEAGSKNRGEGFEMRSDRSRLDRRALLLGGTAAGASLVLGRASPVQAQQSGPTGKKPNIVFILVDNIGWGDFSVYGGTTPTPRIDALANSGIRFNNYNVEGQCTPSRSAILTGRQSVRSGTFTVPHDSHLPYGLAPWEYTIAELLSDSGYATALFGKWHLGSVEGRLPTDQGFDEWWGYKDSMDEAGWTSYALYRELIKATGGESPKIWEGRKGQPSKPVRELDLEVRPLMDEMIIKHTTDYIAKQANAGKPFFVYTALSHAHPPEKVHPDFDQKSPERMGAYSDMMAEMDFRVGQILDEIKQAGVDDNTIVVFSSDNGAGGAPFVIGGSGGPWRGSFSNPPYEGSMRVAAMIRWPGHVPAGVVSQEMLTAHDWLPTLAGMVGESNRVPKDRPIDGINASAFMLGTSKTTGRESYLFFGPDGEPMSVKWKNIKVIFRYADSFEKPIVTPYFPLVYDLSSDPHEDYNLIVYKLDMTWMLGIAGKIVAEYEKSVVEFPNIKTGEDFQGYKK